MRSRAMVFFVLLSTSAFAGDKEDLMAADRAFSVMSMQQGQAAAFLTYMKDDARLFGVAGEPILGRKAAEAKFSSEERRGVAKGTLSWEPFEAFVSKDGSLGWTNGHWTFTSAPDAKGGKESSHGHYVTIWRRDPMGAWKVEADIGTIDAETK